jgi:predicted DsbA family dithiol-disulfide isomerase
VLLERYGPSMADRLSSMFAEAGLPYAATLDKVPNSRRAQALAELARDRGLHDQLHPRLFDAYWARGLDLGDDEVLVSEGRAVGLEEGEIRAAVEDPQYVERIAEQTSAALELGAGGVPAWLVDERALVPGAQPHELFDRVLERLGHQPIAA